MKKIFCTLFCIICVLLISPVHANIPNNPGLESYTTHEPWVETEMGLGLITYPDPSPVPFQLEAGAIYVEAGNSDITFDSEHEFFYVQLPDGSIANHLKTSQPKHIDSGVLLLIGWVISLFVLVWLCRLEIKQNAQKSQN